MLDALVRDQPEPSAMVSIYALISKMRIVSKPNVVENAEAVMQTILRTYSLPNKTFSDLRQLMLNGDFMDPLLSFSKVCRDDLRQLAAGGGQSGRGRAAILGVLSASPQAASTWIAESCSHGAGRLLAASITAPDKKETRP